MDIGEPYRGDGRKKNRRSWDGVKIILKNPTFRNNNYGTRYPRSVKYFKTSDCEGFKFNHPTQKPVALFEYLIKTYTKEGDLVLDNCAGSGTTGVAVINTKRNYILIEKELKYIEIAKQRILKTIENLPTLYETSNNK